MAISISPDPYGFNSRVALYRDEWERTMAQAARANSATEHRALLEKAEYIKRMALEQEAIDMRGMARALDPRAKPPVMLDELALQVTPNPAAPAALKKRKALLCLL